jgi:hypothetical protein
MKKFANLHTVAAFILTILMITSILFSPGSRAASQPDATAAYQTVEAGVSQLFTQTAQAATPPATLTAAAIQTQVQARFDLALTTTALASKPANAQAADLILDPTINAIRSRDAKTATAPGWRSDTQFTAQTTISHAPVAFWTRPGSGFDWIYWSFAPPLTGRYEVFAMISTPANAPPRYTKLATYHLAHADGGSAVRINQAEKIGQSVSLGVYRFQTGEKYSVFLNDFTTEGANITIVADQLWVRPVSVQTEIIATTPTPQALKPNMSGLLAFTRADARLWPVPNVRSVKTYKTLKAEEPLTIIAGPLYGPIRTDSAQQGDWYQVQVGKDSLEYGWIWSGSFRFK